MSQEVLFFQKRIDKQLAFYATSIAGTALECIFVTIYGGASFRERNRNTTMNNDIKMDI